MLRTSRGRLVMMRRSAGSSNFSSISKASTFRTTSAGVNAIAGVLREQSSSVPHFNNPQGQGSAPSSQQGRGPRRNDNRHQHYRPHTNRTYRQTGRYDADTQYGPPANVITGAGPVRGPRPTVPTGPRWQCGECAMWNDADTMGCYVCGAARDPSKCKRMLSEAASSGDRSNGNSGTVAPASVTSTAAPREAAAIVATSRNTQQASNSAGHHRHHQTRTTWAVEEEAPWKCGGCQTPNEGGAAECFACGAAKSEVAPAAPQAVSSVSSATAPPASQPTTARSVDASEKPPVDRNSTRGQSTNRGANAPVVTLAPGTPAPRATNTQQQGPPPTPSSNAGKPTPSKPLPRQNLIDSYTVIRRKAAAATDHTNKLVELYGEVLDSESVIYRDTSAEELEEIKGGEEAAEYAGLGFNAPLMDANGNMDHGRQDARRRHSLALTATLPGKLGFSKDSPANAVAPWSAFDKLHWATAGATHDGGLVAKDDFIHSGPRSFICRQAGISSRNSNLYLKNRVMKVARSIADEERQISTGSGSSGGGSRNGAFSSSVALQRDDSERFSPSGTPSTVHLPDGTDAEAHGVAVDAAALLIRRSSAMLEFRQNRLRTAFDYLARWRERRDNLERYLKELRAERERGGDDVNGVEQQNRSVGTVMAKETAISMMDDPTLLYVNYGGTTLYDDLVAAYADPLVLEEIDDAARADIPHSGRREGVRKSVDFDSICWIAEGFADASSMLEELTRRKAASAIGDRLFRAPCIVEEGSYKLVRQLPLYYLDFFTHKGEGALTRRMLRESIHIFYRRVGMPRGLDPLFAGPPPELTESKGKRQTQYRDMIREATRKRLEELEKQKQAQEAKAKMDAIADSEELSIFDEEHPVNVLRKMGDAPPTTTTTGTTSATGAATANNNSPAPLDLWGTAVEDATSWPNTHADGTQQQQQEQKEVTDEEEAARVANGFTFPSYVIPTAQQRALIEAYFADEDAIVAPDELLDIDVRRSGVGAVLDQLYRHRREAIGENRRRRRTVSIHGRSPCEGPTIRVSVDPLFIEAKMCRVRDIEFEPLHVTNSREGRAGVIVEEEEAEAVHNVAVEGYTAVTSTTPATTTASNSDATTDGAETTAQSTEEPTVTTTTADENTPAKPKKAPRVHASSRPRPQYLQRSADADEEGKQTTFPISTPPSSVAPPAADTVGNLSHATDTAKAAAVISSRTPLALVVMAAYTVQRHHSYNIVENPNVTAEDDGAEAATRLDGADDDAATTTVGGYGEADSQSPPPVPAKQQEKKKKSLFHFIREEEEVLARAEAELVLHYDGADDSVDVSDPNHLTISAKEDALGSQHPLIALGDVNGDVVTKPVVVASPILRDEDGLVDVDGTTNTTTVYEIIDTSVKGTTTTSATTALEKLEKVPLSFTRPYLQDDEALIESLVSSGELMVVGATASSSWKCRSCGFINTQQQSTTTIGGAGGRGEATARVEAYLSDDPQMSSALLFGGGNINNNYANSSSSSPAAAEYCSCYACGASVYADPNGHNGSITAGGVGGFGNYNNGYQQHHQMQHHRHQQRGGGHPYPQQQQAHQQQEQQWAHYSADFEIGKGSAHHHQHMGGGNNGNGDNSPVATTTTAGVDAAWTWGADAAAANPSGDEVAASDGWSDTPNVGGASEQSWGQQPAAGSTTTNAAADAWANVRNNRRDDGSGWGAAAVLGSSNPQPAHEPPSLISSSAPRMHNTPYQFSNLPATSEHGSDYRGYYLHDPSVDPERDYPHLAENHRLAAAMVHSGNNFVPVNFGEIPSFFQTTEAEAENRRRAISGGWMDLNVERHRVVKQPIKQGMMPLCEMGGIGVSLTDAQFTSTKSYRRRDQERASPVHQKQSFRGLMKRTMQRQGERETEAALQKIREEAAEREREQKRRLRRRALSFENDEAVVGDADVMSLFNDGDDLSALRHDSLGDEHHHYNSSSNPQNHQNNGAQMGVGANAASASPPPLPNYQPQSRLGAALFGAPPDDSDILPLGARRH